MLRCVSEAGGRLVMMQVHEGACVSYIAGRAPAGKILREGYYWPTLQRDCSDFINKYNNFQVFTPVSQVLAEALHFVFSLWPFYQWGTDILGPFPIAPGELKFLIVAIDYFTKWIEAEAVACISDEKVCRFYWKNII